MYCIQDTVLPIDISEKLNLTTSMAEMSNCMNVPMSYLHTRGQQIKVLAQVYRETIFNDIIIPYRAKSDEPTQKYEGAIVIEANPGDYDNVLCFDFESLYPTTMIAFNICYTTLLMDDDPTPDSECHVLDFKSHKGCIHDELKRKVKAADVMCKDHHYRFRKVVTLADGTRLHEGIMPKLERNLLSERKIVKKEMAKQEAIYKMATGKAEEKDIAEYKKRGWDIVKKGSLTEKQLSILGVGITVLNAQQLALKISANSIASDLPIPCLVNGTLEYFEINDLSDDGNWSVDEKGNEVSQPKPGIKVWSDIGFTEVKYVIRHKTSKPMVRVSTATGIIVCTEDHSLLLSNGEEVCPGDLDVGDRLLHVPVEDTLVEKVPLTEQTFVVKGQPVDVAKMIRCMRSDGSYPTISAFGENTYRIVITSEPPSNPDAIRSIERLPSKTDYVYDLETASHHFAAGVGDMIVHNSAYGGLGAQQGFIPLVEGAASVTAMGRELIMTAIKYILAKNKGDPNTGKGQADYVGAKGHPEPKGQARLVYGDSVTADTPILCRYRFDDRNDCFFTTFKELALNRTWQTYRDGKEQVIPSGLEVWSDKGFTPIKSIIRHKTTKNIYRVSVPTGVIDVTEDHSLLTADGVEISPLDAKVGDALLTHDLPDCLVTPRLSPLVLADVRHTYGYDTVHGSWFDAKHKLTAAVFYHLVAGLGYNVTVTPDNRVTYTMKKVDNPSTTTSITNLGPTDEYVYDLETENHHFAAGVGRLVVHNTDSGMIRFIGLNTQESFEMGDKVSKQTSHYLKCKLIGVEEDFSITCPSDGKVYRIDAYPRAKISELTDDATKIKIYEYDANPINLQFENLYQRYLLLSKKRYIAYAVNRAGEIIAVIKKGVVLTRRDNCEVLRSMYKDMVTAILDRKEEQAVMYILYDWVHKLFTRQVPDTKLIIYTGVKSVMNYAKKQPAPKNARATENVYIDEDKRPIDDPIGPLDPRLVYPNLPQVLLALKMMRRGDDVPPNTRLEYLYLETAGAEHLGEKAEDFTYYKEHKDELGLRPDYLHYVEKQFSNPATELLEVKYPPTIKLPYEKIDEKIVRLFGELDELSRFRVAKIKEFDRTVPVVPVEVVGWYARCGVCRKGKKLCPAHSKSNKVEGTRTYHSKKVAAQVEYVLDSARKKKADPNLSNEIDPVKYAELVQTCMQWKSRTMLDALYKYHGLKKRAIKRPKQHGVKLRLGTEVLLMAKIKGYAKGTVAKVEQVIDATPTLKKKIYLYHLKMEDGVMLTDIGRSLFATFRYRDSAVMKDILVARGSYQTVVRELEALFHPEKAKKVEQFELREAEEIDE